MTPLRSIACTIVLMYTPIASAQWGSDPTQNLAIANSASDQTQSKIVPTADGGSFLSWFDGIASGYDVRIQKVDATGAEIMPHLGTLVADRGFSSTQDYGLAVAASGDALLVFRDDRPGGTQITAARITPTGAAAWGALGVQLTSTASFVASPKITGTSDGGAMVAWTQDSSVRLQKLDASGAKVWASDVVLTPAAGSYSVSDLHSGGTADGILSMVYQTGGFSSPKRLVAQKFDATGAPLWGASPISVFDTGSLQFGNFPAFVPDNNGGAVFAWYGTSPLQCYAQRILANGSEAFPHNGAPVSTNATQIRVDPHVSFIEETGETVVAWREQNAVQSQFGLGCQKFSPVGQRLFGPQGVVLLPLGGAEITNTRSVGGQYATFVFYSISVGLGQEELRGVRVDATGSPLGAHFSVSTAVGGKARLAVSQSAIGQSILSWNDARTDGSDIYAQNVNCDGSLGAPSLTAGWTDVGSGLAGQAGVPILAGSGTLCPGDAFSLSLTQARPNTTAALIIGVSAINAPLLGGTLVPSPTIVVMGLPTGPAGAIAINSSLASALPPGLIVYLQYWITDAAGIFGVSASNGLKMTAP